MAPLQIPQNLLKEVPMTSTPSPLEPRTAARGSLNLVNVTLEYPDGDGTLKALDAVNLTVQAGQMVSLVGPSGSGKSSLLAAAATLVRPTHGLVLIDGTDATGLGDRGPHRAAPGEDRHHLPAAQPARRP